MSLSPSSFEILSDLLELRLEAFMVTSGEEARERKMLEICQRELAGLQGLARQMIGEPASISTPKPQTVIQAHVPKTKLPRRLQRLMRDLNQAETAARSIA